jgi:hypothetical protein
MKTLNPANQLFSHPMPRKQTSEDFREQARSYPYTANSCRSELARENPTRKIPPQGTCHGKNLRAGRYSETWAGGFITDTKLAVVTITSPLGEAFSFVAVACNI